MSVDAFKAWKNTERVQKGSFICVTQMCCVMNMYCGEQKPTEFGIS